MCSWLYLCAHASLKTSNEAWSTITNQPEYSSHHVRAEISPHSPMNTDTSRESKARGVGRKGRFGGTKLLYILGAPYAPMAEVFLWSSTGCSEGRRGWHWDSCLGLNHTLLSAEYQTGWKRQIFTLSTQIHPQNIFLILVVWEDFSKTCYL